MAWFCRLARADPTASGLPPFGVTGRHRLPSAATGRRVDTGSAGRDEEERPPAPRPLPRAPWEYAQPERPAGARAGTGTGTGGSRWTAAMGRRSDHALARCLQPVYGQAAPDRPGRGRWSPRPGRGPVSRRQPGRRPASSGSHLGMPIRVPQASLAPQLRAQR